jgi:hypothetical protein
VVQPKGVGSTEPLKSGGAGFAGAGAGKRLRTSGVEDVVRLEERVVRLDALRTQRLELPSVLGEASGCMQVEEPRWLVADVPEVVDSVRRSEHVRARRPVDDLVSEVELDLALEDVERVAVTLVEVGLDSISGLHLTFAERELGADREIPVPSDFFTFARVESDRLVRSGHAGNLLREARQNDGGRVDAAVLGRVVLVEGGILAAEVVAEAERGHVEVEAARGRLAVVVETVDDVGREDDERSSRMRSRAVAEVKRELAFEDEERIGVVVVDMRVRAAFAGPVRELGDRDLVGVHEQRRTALRRPVGDVLTLRSTRPAKQDEAGVTRRVLGRGMLVEIGRRATDEVAVSRVRSVKDEEPRRPVACDLESVHYLGGNERPGLGADPMLAILEPERELSVEHEQRLGVSSVDVEGRSSPAWSGAHFDRTELLDVHEERDAQLLAAEDDLAFADLDHLTAA